jgi:hypothetical protein
MTEARRDTTGTPSTKKRSHDGDNRLSTAHLWEIAALEANTGVRLLEGDHEQRMREQTLKIRRRRGGVDSDDQSELR